MKLSHIFALTLMASAGAAYAADMTAADTDGDGMISADEFAGVRREGAFVFSPPRFRAVFLWALCFFFGPQVGRHKRVDLMVP